MSDEKKDWEQRFNHKWRQGVRDPNGDTYYPMSEHGAPQLEDCTDKVKDFIAAEITAAEIRGIMRERQHISNALKRDGVLTGSSVCAANGEYPAMVQCIEERVRAEEAAKYKAVVEAATKGQRTLRILIGHFTWMDSRMSGKAERAYEALKSALAALEGK